MIEPLAVTAIGTGPPVVFCHGLFGQGKNWTNIAKRLAEAGLPHEGLGEHQIVLPDMPNHGRSPWTDSFDYVAAADAVADVCRGVAAGAPVSPGAPVVPDAPGSPAPQVSLVGHSMGGKIAMLVALRHPGLIKRLAVVDVAPVAYPFPDSFDAYLTAMRGLDLAALGNRGEADQALAAAVPDDRVRGFLLQNLRFEAGVWSWQPNLALLQRDLAVLAGWPAEAAAAAAAYQGQTVWIGGADSPYITDDSVATMTALFPSVRRVTVKGAGHWVHSDQPEVFTAIIARWLGSAR